MEAKAVNNSLLVERKPIKIARSSLYVVRGLFVIVLLGKTYEKET